MPDLEIDDNAKHRTFHRDKLNPDVDLFTPDFKRDSKGRYFMQLPGYGKWMVSNEPGSKIISQGSEDELGKPATDPGSIKTGYLNAETRINVGDNIELNALTGCIYIGDYIKRVNAWIGICGNGWYGYNGSNMTFGYFLEASGDFGRGDVLIGDYASDEYIWWDDSDGKLYIKGDLIIQGDIQSANYLAGSTGYKLTYLTGSAEFQDVIVRGRVMMETGSSGSADYIAESVGRKWAAESGADVTGAHTSNDTNYVYGDTAFSVKTGAERARNTINAFNRYVTWLQSSDMELSGVSTGPAVVIDRNGIYGFGSGSENTFHINAITGNVFLRGEIDASAGLIAGWDIQSDRLWKLKTESGHYNKIEFNSRIGAGVAPHIQVYSDTDSNFGSPTGVQLTCDSGASPVPRMDVYDNGVKRTMVNKDGIHMFDTSSNRRVLINMNGIYWYNSGGSVMNQILASTADGDVTFGGGVVRCFSNGVRVAENKTFAAAGSGGTYTQFYTAGYNGIIEITSNSSGTFGIKDQNSANYIMKWTNYDIQSWKSFFPDTSGVRDLGQPSYRWDDVCCYALKGRYSDIYLDQPGHIVLTNHTDPSLTGVYNLGGASRWWAYVNCIDVTTHSLVYYDDGIELLDGTKVDDIEAIRRIKPGKKMFKDDIPYLDKKTFPKHIFHPAPIAEDDVYEEEKMIDEDGNKTRIQKLVYKKGDKMGDDGVNAIQLMSLILGSIKQLDDRISKLEK